MMKKCLLAIGLLSLAFAVSCAKGGNGVVPEISVNITNPTDVVPNQIYPGQPVTVTATVSGTSTMSVNWTVTGGGTLSNPTALTVVYTAPSTPTSGVTITATLTSDSSVTSNLLITVVDVATQVSPSAPSVGLGLTQTFTAVALPADAPQTPLAWSCTVNNVQCNTNDFKVDSNSSNLAYYTYTSAENCTGTCNLAISALSTLGDGNGCANPKNCILAKGSIVPSRLAGIYAFQFSGYNTNHHFVALAGTFTVAGDGSISGVEDQLTNTGVSTGVPITSGSYTPATNTDMSNSNNAGTLILTPHSGAVPTQFQVVLDGAGDIEMVESDANGKGSGVAQSSAGSGAIKSGQVYAFGFTGVDSSGNRAGYVGIFPFGTSNTIVAGSMDVNDNGNSSNGVCSAPPCSVTGTYQVTGSSSGQLTLTAPVAMTFDFFIASGSSSKATPLTFYVISTDPTSNPAVVGTMVLQDQDSSQPYNIAAFNGISVSALTGVDGTNTNVSLTLGNTDGKGDFSGQFDQNDAGTILSNAAFPPSGSTNYTYTASSSNNGRYTFPMLGNPTASTPVPPLPFILYASGQNRGFLLDQSSSAVMAGTMNPEGKGAGLFGNPDLPGTFGAATVSSGNSAVTPIAANLLITWANSAMNTGSCTTQCVNGTEYLDDPTGIPVAGAYTFSGPFGTGTGTITLTAPSAQTYGIYVLDSSDCGGQSLVCAIQDFYMIDEDKTNTQPSVIFAKQ